VLVRLVCCSWSERPPQSEAVPTTSDVAVDD